MAQDFGDDMGNALLNFVTRQVENYLRFGRGRERAFDWWQRHYKKEGNTPEAAKAMAEKQSSREQVVVPLVLPRKPPTMRRYAARMVPMPPPTRTNGETGSLPSHAKMRKPSQGMSRNLRT